MNFTNPMPQKRTADGLARAVSIVGCESAALQAVIQVETGGAGYDHAGRPKALFEPHLMYRALANDEAKLARAVAAGLAYQKWGTRPYPADSYPHIAAACAIDEDAALRSTSWGLPQILGENWHAAGYSSAASMVEAFVSGGEDEHLDAMGKFILARGLAKYLCVRNWASFAKGYNGAGYAKNHYDTRLAAAYAALKGKPLVAAVKPASTPAALNAQIAASATATKASSSTGAVIAAGAVVAIPVAHHFGSIGLTGSLVGAALLSVSAVALAVIARAQAATAKTFTTAGA